jgi:hypothetical protein
MTKVVWFDNYWGWLERLVKRLRKWIEEEEWKYLSLSR